MKFIVAEVERRIDWLEGLEVNVDLPFFAFCGDDFTAVDNQPIGRDLVIKLKPLLSRGNCRQDRESVDTRFDVGSSSLQTVRYSFNKLRREGEGGGGGVKHTYSSANIFAARDTWSLGAGEAHG